MPLNNNVRRAETPRCHKHGHKKAEYLVLNKKLY